MPLSQHRSHYRVTFAVLLVGVGAYSLLQSLVLPVLPTIQHSLHTSQSAVTWVLTAYLLSASVFTPLLGRVGDIVGKERMYVATLGALALGSLMAALASSIGIMIFARVVQGIGGGALPLAFGIIRDEFPRPRVTNAIGVTAALTAVGGGAGIVLGGPIIEALNYHWLFWIPMIMVIGAGVAAHLLVPESPVRAPGRINWFAAALLSGWLVCLLLAVSEGPSWGWDSERVLALLAAAAAGAVVWVRVETRAQQPLIDMKMMRQRAVLTINLVALLVGVGLYGIFAFLPDFVQTPPSYGYGFGASVVKSGLFFLPNATSMFFFGLVSGRLAGRFGARAILIVGSVVGVVPFALLAAAHGQEWEVFVAMGALGAGFGLAFSAMSSLIVAAVPPEQTGVASGMNANIRTIGGSIGAAVMASIVSSSVAANAVPKEVGYTRGFVVLAITAGLAALASLGVPMVRRAAGGAALGDRLAETAMATSEPPVAKVRSGTVGGKLAPGAVNGGEGGP